MICLGAEAAVNPDLGGNALRQCLTTYLESFFPPAFSSAKLRLLVRTTWRPWRISARAARSMNSSELPARRDAAA